MPIFSSHFNHKKSSTSFPSTETYFSSSFRKTKDISQMFIDKNSIIKKLQQLMLDYKDIQTKMFLSKTISYLINNLFSFPQKTQQQNTQNYKHQNHTSKSNQTTEILNSLDSKLKYCPMEVSRIVSQNHLITQQTQRQNKQLSQTALSQGFFQTTINNIQQQSQIVEETPSEAETVQCQCGLFEALLDLVSKLMELGLINDRSDREDECFEIDQTFVEQITEEIVAKFQSVENNFKIKVQTLNQSLQAKELQIVKQRMITKDFQQKTQELKVKYQQNQDFRLQNTKLIEQVKFSNTKIQELSKQLDLFKNQNKLLKKEMNEVTQKLRLTQKKVQKLSASKQLTEQIAGHSIEGLRLQVDLKQQEIRNLKTIIETLQKRTNQYGDRHYICSENTYESDSIGERNNTRLESNKTESNLFR